MKHTQSSGFTIVESLIVLAISSLLLLSAVRMVGAQQSKAQFKSAMTDITSRIQKTINEASTGYYPTSAPFSCERDGASNEIKITNTPSAQGTNNDCIYLGRAILFGVNNGADPEEYMVHTLVGLKETGGKAVNTFKDADVTLVATPAADLRETRKMQYGTTVAWMERSADGAGIIGVAFVTNISEIGYNGSTNELKSGSSIGSIIPITGNGGAKPGMNDAAGRNRLENVFKDDTPVPAPGSSQVCIKSGTTDQSGLITIGPGGNNSTVEYQIFQSDDCS